MSVFSRTIWICGVLLVVMMTSVLGVASSGKLANASYSAGTESMLKMQAPALDCQHYDEARILAQNQHAIKEVIQAAKNESKAAHTCCSPFSNILTFPAIILQELDLGLGHSLALIRKERVAKPHSFSEIIYRPPIS